MIFFRKILGSVPSPAVMPRLHSLSRTPLHVALAATALSAVGCTSDESWAVAGSGETGTEAESDAIGSSSSGLADSSSSGGGEVLTYYEDIRPLMAKHCEVCHTDGATAPFSLDSYESVEATAPAIAAVVQSRTMPPFAMTADGSCGDWASPSWLTDDEIDTIVRWSTSDRAAGEDTLAAPEPPVLPELDGRGTVEQVKIPVYEPSDAQGVDDYRCFAVDLGLDAQRFLTGYDVLPDNAAIVHHLLGYRIIPSRGSNAEVLAELEAADDAPGWSCFGSAGEGLQASGVPVAWAPGGGAQNYPFETGIRFAEGDILVVQIHYAIADENGPDETALDLQWAESVDREGIQVLWDKFLSQGLLPGGVELEPGQESVEYSWDISFDQILSFRDLDYAAVDLMGVTPHMHKFGKRMSIDLESADGDLCVADVHQWDFNWQRAYFYEDPVRVGRDAMVHVTCDYDTSNVADPVPAGLGSSDEMCLMGLYFAESK